MSLEIQIHTTSARTYSSTSSNQCGKAKNEKKKESTKANSKGWYNKIQEVMKSFCVPFHLSIIIIIIPFGQNLNRLKVKGSASELTKKYIDR